MLWREGFSIMIWGHEQFGKCLLSKINIQMCQTVWINTLAHRSNSRYRKHFKECEQNFQVQIESFFFSIWVFFYEHSRITGLQRKGEVISLTPHYHFHPLHRHLDISRAITAESSPLRIASSQTRTGNLWFPSASR